MKKQRKKDYFEGRKVYELTEEEQGASITKKEANACRHKAEKRWYRRLVVLNILIIVVVLAMLASGLEEIKEWAGLVEEQVSEQFSEDYVEDKTQYRYDPMADIPFELELVVYGIIFFVVLIPALYYMYAQYRTMALRITEKNFPEVYQLIEEYARRLGIKTPKAYVMQQNGIINAFSAFLPRRQWICIHSELFEVAYREHKDMNALAFIIAHEISHIYYGHATLHYNLPILFSSSIPLFGQIASRTREFSCDRLAQRLTNYDGVRAIMMLIVDRHLYPMVDVQDYVNTTINERGFFLWLINLLSTHPTMPKRLRALIQWNGSGELY